MHDIPDPAFDLAGEASLVELLDDPIAKLLMDRDGVRRDDVLSIMRRLAGNDGGPVVVTSAA